MRNVTICSFVYSRDYDAIYYLYRIKKYTYHQDSVVVLLRYAIATFP